MTSRRLRMIGTAAVGALLAVACAGCGGHTNVAKPSEAQILTRLEGDPSAELPSTTTASQYRCVATVFLSYGDGASLQQWIEKKIGANSVEGSNVAAAQRAAARCFHH